MYPNIIESIMNYDLYIHLHDEKFLDFPIPRANINKQITRFVEKIQLKSHSY